MRSLSMLVYIIGLLIGSREGGFVVSAPAFDEAVFQGSSNSTGTPAPESAHDEPPVFLADPKQLGSGGGQPVPTTTIAHNDPPVFLADPKQAKEPAVTGDASTTIQPTPTTLQTTTHKDPPIFLANPQDPPKGPAPIRPAPTTPHADPPVFLPNPQQQPAGPQAPAAAAAKPEVVVEIITDPPTPSPTPAPATPPLTPPPPRKPKGPCHQEADMVKAGIQGGMQDVIPPSCTEEGYWKVVQIGGLGGNSRYCVNPLDGNEVSGTRVDAQKEMPTCGACHKELETLLTRIPIPGKFIPACDESGWYQTKQSDPSTGLSYCVHQLTGRNTTVPKEEPVECTKSSDTIQTSAQQVSVDTFQQKRSGPCYEEQDRILAGIAKGLPGASAPACTPEGFWKVIQETGSGHQCVNPVTGKPVNGTYKEAKDGLPTCGACHTKLERILSRKPVIGLLPPACDDDGWYQLKQIEIYSFCVDKRTGERTTSLQRESEAGTLECYAPKNQESGAKDNTFTEIVTSS